MTISTLMFFAAVVCADGDMKQCENIEVYRPAYNWAHNIDDVWCQNSGKYIINEHVNKMLGVYYQDKWKPVAIYCEKVLNFSVGDNHDPWVGPLNK